MGGTLASCSTLPICAEDAMYNDFNRRQPPNVEKLPLPPLIVGEGPHWSTKTESLYLVDTPTSTIYRYNPATDRYYSAKIDVPCIGFMIPVQGSENLFVIGGHITLYLVKWNGFSHRIDSLTPLCKIASEPETNRINDGKCDPVGRLWFGTMKLEDFLNGKVASFYSYTKDKGLVKHLSEIGISNGLAWNTNKNVLYYIDTVKQCVDALDYSAMGAIGNRRIAFDFKKYGFPFFPDGMTIDKDGNLWVACYGGSRVIKVDPDTSELLDQVEIPTANVTSVAWGGPTLSDLYVTTNNVDNDGTDGNGGCTFRITGLSTHGLPMTDFKMELPPEVEKLPLPQLVVGEAPHWSPTTESLYLVDTATATIYRYKPGTKRYYSAKIDVPCIGFIIPVYGSDNLFVIGGHITLYLVKWDGVSSDIDSLTPLCKVASEPDTNRINDGKCDPDGRLWFGTMKLEDFLNGAVASFYSYTKKSGLERHLCEVGISNGLSWDLNKGLFYYIDTAKQSVDVLDYSTTGGISNRRIAFDFKENGFSFFPDGMTIDKDGNLWVACYGGSRVLQIDPDTNSLLGEVEIPTANVTSVAWGGPTFSDLYVTTNNLDNDGTDKNGGCTFRVKGLVTHGLPMMDFKMK